MFNNLNSSFQLVQSLTTLVLGLAPVVVWDSQVKDGYKRTQAQASDGNVLEETSKHAPSAAWDGKRNSDVVGELLKNSKDKAYGANGETLICQSTCWDEAAYGLIWNHWRFFFFFKSSSELGWWGLGC